MKFALVLSTFLLAHAQPPKGAGVPGDDRMITKVVKLLEHMLEESAHDAEEMRVLYAKFKCYCDTSEKEKKESIEKLTKHISLLEAEIEELQGSNGEASIKAAELKANMEDNEHQRKVATKLREKEHKAFEEEKADLEAAIAQLSDAIKTLAAVGADQTKSVGADHEQFMKGNMKEPGFLQGGRTSGAAYESLKSAVSAAAAFMNEKQQKAVSSFMQAPFTGTYTAQSGQIMGILKQMKETFEKNLIAAIKTEKEQQEAYENLMETKKEEYKEMAKQSEEAQALMGENDGGLETKKGQLAAAKAEKADNEKFLEELLPMCAKKAKQYDQRKIMRANEDAAITEAISILNSDAAFATFGEVDSTSHRGPPMFLQTVQKHFPGVSDADVRQVMQRLLKRAAAGHRAPRINHVISVLQAENPFDKVLAEIDKMLELIEEEGKSDKEKKAWCIKERTENKADLKEKEAEILRLKSQIDKLETTIEDQKDQIEEVEKSLEENHNTQVTLTADRRESNVAYQKDIKNLVAAEALVENAIKVLKNYYDEIGEAFLQNRKEEPAPPPTWEGDFKGQSTQGNKAIEMLEFILEDTKKEEAEAHTTEEEAQHDYEDAMTEAKKEQAKKEKELASLQESLADNEKDLLSAKEDHKATVEDRDSIVEYLEKIKPGCDFIEKNYDYRVESRETETKALNIAKKSLEESPAYKNAEAEATVEGYGKCKDKCVDNAEHVECKACMNDISIPGYCAGHADTLGCNEGPLE